ncbi:MAG: DUF2059 domain-containing protein [Pseudomonadota bacterium]
MRGITLCIALLLTSLATADEASHTAAAERLLAVSRASQSIDTVYDAMGTQMRQMGEQLGIDEAQRPIFDRYMKRVIGVMREEMTWEKLRPQMVAAYVQVYSEQELDDISDFYASPTGQKFLEKMPELMTLSMQMTQQMMGSVYGRLEQLQTELQRELEASERGHNHGS